MTRQKENKERKHAAAMQEKRVKRAREDMCDRAVELVLILLYSSLVDEYNFTPEMLNALRKRMDRYATHIASGNISVTEMREIMLKQGVDMSKIGTGSAE